MLKILHNRVEKSKYQMVEKMLKLGVDPNIQIFDGFRPLYKAIFSKTCQNGYFLIVFK